jgi:hypothetical protein
MAVESGMVGLGLVTDRYSFIMILKMYISLLRNRVRRQESSELLFLYTVASNSFFTSNRTRSTLLEVLFCI